MTPTAKSIRRDFDDYLEAARYLESNHTTVSLRKEAIATRDAFLRRAPGLIATLLSDIETVADRADGDECANPEMCRSDASLMHLCTRCYARVIFGD